MRQEDNSEFESEAQALRGRLEVVATSFAQQASISSEVKADAHRLLQIGDSLQRGIALFVLRRFEEADDAFEDAISDFGYHEFDPAFWRANSWFAAKKYDRAFLLYQRCLDIEPTDVSVARMMAICLMKTRTGSLVENHLAAQKVLLKAKQNCQPGTDDFAELHNDLGDAYRIYDVARDKGPPADLDAARAAYGVALDTYEALGDMASWADVAVYAAPVVAQCRPRDPVPQLLEALALLDRAMPHIDRQMRPLTWSNACLNHAVCLARLGTRSNRLFWRVVQSYRRALRDSDLSRDANGFATSHSNLAKWYQDWKLGPLAIGRRLAIRHLRQALLGWSKSEYPLEFAATQLRIAKHLASIGNNGLIARRRNDEAYSRLALALEVYSPNVCPLQWSECHTVAGLLVLVKSPVAGCETVSQRAKAAKEHCRLALSVLDAKEHSAEVLNVRHILNVIDSTLS